MDLAYQTNQPIFLQHHLYKGTMRYAIQFVGYDILRETILYSQFLLFNFIDVILHKHMRVCSSYTNTKPIELEPFYVLHYASWAYHEKLLDWSRMWDTLSY